MLTSAMTTNRDNSVLGVPTIQERLNALKSFAALMVRISNAEVDRAMPPSCSEGSGSWTLERAEEWFWFHVARIAREAVDVIFALENAVHDLRELDRSVELRKSGAADAGR